MEETVRDKIYDISEERVEETPLAFKRRLYGEIDWDARLLCVKGPRGVGKTTMLLQRIKEALGTERALYVSLDNVWVDAREVYGLAEYHLGRGGTHLFLDEVHKMENWQNLVKSHHFDSITHAVSLGAGYSSPGSFYADLAVRLTSYPTAYYSPYYYGAYDAMDSAGRSINVGAPLEKLERSVYDVMMTLGWRF